MTNETFIRAITFSLRCTKKQLIILERALKEELSYQRALSLQSGSEEEADEVKHLLDRVRKKLSDIGKGK